MARKADTDKIKRHDGYIVNMEEIKEGIEEGNLRFSYMRFVDQNGNKGSIAFTIPEDLQEGFTRSVVQMFADAIADSTYQYDTELEKAKRKVKHVEIVSHTTGNNVKEGELS